MKKVIVTDTKYRMALSPVRELAKKGYDICAVDFDTVRKKESLGHFSKYPTQKTYVREDFDGFFEDIKALSQKSRPVVIASNRKALTLIAENKEKFEPFCDFLIPSPESLKKADDKSIISEIAQNIGIPIPKTTSLSKHESIEEMADCVNFPCIIKFRNGEALGKKPKDRYKIVYNKEDFIKAYRTMHQTDKNPIASDYISGNDIGVAVVMNKNCEPVDFICYESLREYPIEGGPTCFSRTIFDRNLLRYAVGLLKEINFCGIAMLDFKGSIDNPYFLEINPRIWGSANITCISKSSFFESYVKAAAGSNTSIDPDTCLPNYKTGAKMRFTPQSIICFFAHMKKSKNKAKIFCEYTKSFFDLSVRDGLFAIDDPMPYIHYIKNLLIGKGKE